MRRLGLFEIDDIPKDIPAPYTYTVHLLGGDDYEMPYDIEVDLQSPPEKPPIPLEQAVPGEPEYYQWQEWLRFQEARTHQAKIYEGYAEYCERVSDYIRANCLFIQTIDLGSGYGEKIGGNYFEAIKYGLVDETADDWEAIYNAALCPQVSLDDIKQAMANNFGARWGGQEIFDALGNVEGGQGEYISTKLWETDLMIRLGETEPVYSERGIKERARMIAALKIPQLFSILESDKALKEARSKG